jgi:dUTP pyrophosphatase
MELNIKCLNNTAKGIYTINTEQIERQDAGYDLYYCGEDITIPPMYFLWKSHATPKATMLGLGVACEPLFGGGYYLYARSSISKTPLILANNVGIIDAGYRGEIKAAVKNLSSKPYTVKTGDKLFQLCMYNLRSFQVNIVDEISDSIRGDGGFGSTNLNLTNSSIVSSMTLPPPSPLQHISSVQHNVPSIDVKDLSVNSSPPHCQLKRLEDKDVEEKV